MQLSNCRQLNIDIFTIGENDFEDITDSHGWHGLKISAFDATEQKKNHMLKNMLKSAREGMKEVEEEGTLKAGKDSEMEEEIEGMIY